MKIALILPAPPSYSETFFCSMIKGLQDNGHKVVLVTKVSTQTFEGCEHRFHPKVYRSFVRQYLAFIDIGFRLLPHLKRVLHYIRLEREAQTPIWRIIEKTYINATLLRLKTDWIHFGFATMAIDRELVPRVIGTKMGVSFRGYDIGVYPLKHPGCYDTLWKYVDKVHTISDDLLNKAYQLGLPNTVEVTKIRPAIDVGVFASNQLKINIKQPILFLTIGRLHWKKGYVDMLHALKYLHDDGIDFIYTIVGEGQDYERIAYTAHRLGILDKVRFLGKLTHADVKLELMKTDVYLQYSIQEGFCNAVLEAQALGTLCVVSNAEGLAENVIHGETGWVVDRFAPDLLAEQIKEVLSLSESERQKNQEQAIQRVKKQFSLVQQQQAFHQFYTT